MSFPTGEFISISKSNSVFFLTTVCSCSVMLFCEKNDCVLVQKSPVGSCFFACSIGGPNVFCSTFGSGWRCVCCSAFSSGLLSFSVAGSSFFLISSSASLSVSEYHFQNVSFLS